MSGIEVVGIVLGAIPLVIKGILLPPCDSQH